MGDETSISELVREISRALSRMDPELVARETAGLEAERLIARLGLRHPMTMPAAMRLVCEETSGGRLDEIEATARELVERLAATTEGER
jgi:hypothetical protein